MGKGKVHYIEVLSDEDEITHIQDSGQRSGEGEPQHIEVAEEKQLQEGVKKVTTATLSRVPKYYTFRVKCILQG